MSRTQKGTKAPGWEYWGRRRLLGGAGGRGTRAKRLGIKHERRVLAREARARVE